MIASVNMVNVHAFCLASESRYYHAPRICICYLLLHERGDRGAREGGREDGARYRRTRRYASNRQRNYSKGIH